MDNISLIISLLALSGSLFTYLYHDRKLKKQERLIHEYELHKIDAEKEDAKNAAIRANCINMGAGKRIIKIFNAGKVKATNIRFESNPPEFMSWVRTSAEFPFPYMNPQDGIELFATVYVGMPNPEIKLIWDDEFKKDNEHTQILTL